MGALLSPIGRLADAHPQAVYSICLALAAVAVAFGLAGLAWRR